MSTIFQTHQSNDGTIQSARLHIPGCGNNKVRDGSSIAIEIEGGKITLLVFGDINSPVPTHEIDMTGALESARAKVVYNAMPIPEPKVQTTVTPLFVEPEKGRIFGKK